MALRHILTTVCIAISLTDAASIRQAVNQPKDRCDSPIYCKGELLQTVQLAEIFNDSKTFVDLAQIHDPDVTLANFKKLMEMTNHKPNRSQVKQYVAENFVMQGELHNWTLPDWQENPPFFKQIRDPAFRKWANNLNAIWKTLARKISDDVAVNPDRHSLIYVKNGFIVAGGRFQEFYYWDSYWVIEGLLISNMYKTARGMIDNFLSMVEQYGFIPNGARVYYLMRSQPPFLIPMVAAYLDFTKDYDYLSKNIALLDKEFAFWQEKKTIDVKKNGKTYTMAHYLVNSDGPRPESYKEDYKIAQRLPESERRTFYENIKAGAESGWDFSSRWFIGKNVKANLSLVNISTEDIIPVDLNALLQQNARLLQKFHAALGHTSKAQYYEKVARIYQDGIDNVLWNEEEGTWLDYDMKNIRPRKGFYPSNLTPLYTKSYDPLKAQNYALKSVHYLMKKNIYDYFGTPTSFKQTGEQWDFPNAWPPLQSFIVSGLYKTREPVAVDMAKILAARWLRSNYIGYEESGKMFEKYDAVYPGRGGGGGEYKVQDGFGFTNGVALEFLYTFPDITATDPVPYDENYNDVDR